MLCKYKDILGKPNVGIHSIRFFDIAIIDVLLTIIGSAIIAKLLKTNFIITLIIIFIIGVIMHRIFCVRTTIDRMIF